MDANNKQSVKELIGEIKEGLSQVSSSSKDEVRIMKAMLNDFDYKVDVYGKVEDGYGVVGTYCPAEDARNMISGIISSAAKVPQAEATELAKSYEFKKRDAESMIDISKEFVNTFLQTNRKLPLGAREMSNVSLSLKTVKPTIKPYPLKVGINEDGTARYTKANAAVKAHESIKVFSPCPKWVK